MNTRSVWQSARAIPTAVQPRLCAAPVKRWALAVCIALAVVYGPFVVAAVHTWWFDGANTWWRADMLKYCLLVPGGFILEYASAALYRRHPDLSAASLFALSGALSAILVAATAWLAAGLRWWRWIALAILAGLSAFGAVVVDAVMRA